MQQNHLMIWISLFMAWVVTGCQREVKDATSVAALPGIYPDYIGVTIPAGIAPLNFNATGEGVEAVDVVVRGSKGGRMHAQGAYADFDIDGWHDLTRRNKGGSITFTVCVRHNGKWTRYRDFKVYVSPYALDAWGLTYRLIDPGYEVGGDIGIYQRHLATFDEYAILTENAVPGHCMNCHTPNRTDPSQLTMQVRGAHGGTLVRQQGHDTWYDTKTDSTRAAGSYAYWHPSGRYVAYSANAVHQSFFTGRSSNLEVYHLFSNVELLDTRTDKLVLSPLLQTPDQEIFPAFSADGKTLYYSTSRSLNLPADYLKVKCSIVALPFDARTATFGTRADTLLNGLRDNCSYVMARPSYDGRWLMYTVASRSNFPIAQRDADLWLMDLRSRRSWPLTMVNSRETESYHNWSADSHWFVFSSKRGDGLHTRLYLASVDRQGRATKPFLLPQRNPWDYYHKLFKAYNVPDFTKARVEVNTHAMARDIVQGKRRMVTIR